MNFLFLSLKQWRKKMKDQVQIFVWCDHWPAIHEENRWIYVSCVQVIHTTSTWAHFQIFCWSNSFQVQVSQVCCFTAAFHQQPGSTSTNMKSHNPIFNLFFLFLFACFFIQNFISWRIWDKSIEIDPRTSSIVMEEI